MSKSMMYAMGETDEWISSQSTPEKRLMANVLQRAIRDFLEMEDKEGRFIEVGSGTFDMDDELFDKYHGEDGKNGPRVTSEGREDRNLIRWFTSKSRHAFSFLFIMEALDMEGSREALLKVIQSETIKDRPQLTTTQV